jgi:hypothetical protein
MRIASEIAIGICLTAVWSYFAEFAFRPYPDTPEKLVLTYVAFAAFLAVAARLGSIISGRGGKK